MDIEQKKIEVKEDIARGPSNVIFARITICDEVQLADLMKVQFTPYFRGSAGNTVEEAAQLNSNTTVDLSSTGVGRVMVGMTVSGSNIPASTTVSTVVSDTRITISNAATSSSGNVELTFGHPDALPTVCEKLAQQRALLHGASVSGIMKFNFAPGTAYTSTGALTMPVLEDSTQSNKTTLPFITLHDFTDAGGQVTLSTTSNANTTITDDDGVSTKYFTDFSKYFMTRSRANGELVSVDENTAPYATPTTAEPFIPANTINGETYGGTAVDPTANSDVRYEYSLVANSEPVAGGHVGGGYDLAEDHYTGNTYVWMEVSNVTGTFSAEEELLDFANNSCTVKSSANTSTVLLELFETDGTFVAGELLTDRATNASVFSTEVGSNTEVNITLTGSTFDTGSNTDITLGYAESTTITLDTDSISRSGSTVTVETTEDHGILSGERIVLKGADDIYDEFNGTFEVEDTTSNTLSFTTTNSGSVTPTGNFSMVKGVVFGRTSNASGAVRVRTVNATANVIFQSANLDVGFAIGNTVTGTTSGGTGSIDSRNKKGEWYKARDKEVKVFNSGTGVWTIDTAANIGEFWNKNFEPVRISNIIPATGSGTSAVAAKMVLTKALATSGDATGGYDGTLTTKLPGTYLAYPLKTWEDQTHNSVVTLDAYNNFANIIIAPEGLEIDYDTWKPLGAGNNGTDLNQDGSVDTAAHNAEECTILNKSEFQSKLGPYNTALTSPADDVFRSSNPDLRSSAKKTDVPAGTYPSVNANPFFPSTGGTHKPIADEENDIKGTQPGLLDANAVYAGAYSEYSKGAVDPGGTGAAARDYRFFIQNDQKWIYASPSGVDYKTPNASDIKDQQFTSTSPATEIGNVATKAAITGLSGTSTVTAAGPNTTGAACSGASHVTAGNNNKTFSVGALTIPATGAGQINYASILKVLTETCAATTGCSTGAHTTESACNAGHGGAGTYWTTTYGLTTTATTEVPCAYNRVQQWLTATGANVSVGSTTGMQANMAVLYQLLLDLTTDAHGIAYVDPNEPSSPGSEPCRSDVSFRKETQDCKKAIDDLIVAHAAYKTGTGSISAHNFASGAFSRTTGTNGKTYVQCITGATAGTDGVKSAEAEIATYKDGIKNRITEITNRIGYLNGKNPAVSGNTAFQQVGANGAGFTGYAFSGGNGYANTIFSHANFLAGKKIKLFGKILAAISDVDTVYTQIKSKRSEYYEYNQ